MYSSIVDNLLKDGAKKPTLSKFLTIEEQKQLENQNKLNVIFSNNYDDEIRKRAFVYSKFIDCEADFKICIYQIQYDDHFGKITHPQILGTVLGLGLTRDVIGDIIIGEETYIICCEEISKYIESNLLMINKTPVSLIKTKKINDSPNNYIDYKIVIPSMRLDSVVSKSANLSREKAKDYINGKFVRVNGIVNTNNDYLLKEKDVISITKYGRIIIDEVLGTSKKDKIILKIKKTK